MTKNVFSGLINALKLEVDSEDKSPLHVGEVMACWLYLAIMDESTVYLQVGLNTTTDDDVIRILKESLTQCKSQSDRLKNFMLKEGIHSPPVSEAKPNSEPNSIPLGTKLTDDEIMNGLSIKTVSAVMHCATSLSQSIRHDVGLMFGQFMNEKIVFGDELKTLMRERSWIKVPPYYYPPGLPQNG